MVVVAALLPELPQPAAAKAKTTAMIAAIFTQAAARSGPRPQGPDHREIEALAVDHVARDPLHVLRRHLVELGEDLLRVGSPALEHFAPQPEHDQSLGRLELEDEAAL